MCVLVGLHASLSLCPSLFLSHVFHLSVRINAKTAKPTPFQVSNFAVSTAMHGSVRTNAAQHMTFFHKVSPTRRHENTANDGGRCEYMRQFGILSGACTPPRVCHAGRRSSRRTGVLLSGASLLDASTFVDCTRRRVGQGNIITFRLPCYVTLQLTRTSAWLFVPPCRRVLFGLALAVALDALCRCRTFHVAGACLAVLRRRTWHTVLGNVLIAPVTGKGYGAWRAWHRCTLSMRYTNIPPKAFLAKMPLFCRRSADVRRFEHKRRHVLILLKLVAG